MSRNVEVLLLKPMAKIGHEGECVRVKAGFARNYLIPSGVAISIGDANRKQIEALNRAREIRLAKELDMARELANRVAQASVVISVKTGENGKLFGSVTTMDIVEKLVEQGIEIDRSILNLPAAIKSLGQHEVEVCPHADVKAILKVEVVSENPITTTL